MPQHAGQTTNGGTQHGQSRANLEQEVEQLVAEIANRIRSAEPQQQGRLKDLAQILVQEEISSIQTEPETSSTEYFAQRRPNPLAGGILLTIFGAGLALIFAPVGLTLMGIGLVLVVWGAILSWVKK